MDKNKVMELLNNSPGVEDVEEIDYKPEIMVLRFYYRFDSDEIEAAKDYANTQTQDEHKWYDEYYLPYLTDIATDEVRDNLEELVDETGIDVEYINYELGREDGACEFIAAFTEEDLELDIDKVVEDLNK